MDKQVALRAFPRERTRWAWLVGTFFGAGFLRPGPGTYGSVAAVLLWLAVAYGLHPAPWALALGTAIAAAVTTWFGILAATIVARESDRKDPGHIVIDEVVGQWIALIAMPATWQCALLALILFRLFDITKPPPVRQLERFPDGMGIMLDDVAAGLLALGFGLSIVRIARFFL